MGPTKRRPKLIYTHHRLGSLKINTVEFKSPSHCYQLPGNAQNTFAQIGRGEAKEEGDDDDVTNNDGSNHNTQQFS